MREKNVGNDKALCCRPLRGLRRMSNSLVYEIMIFFRMGFDQGLY